MVLLAAGDLTYTVKVDKATKVVTEVDMDLTDPIRKGAILLLDIVQPKDRAKMEVNKLDIEYADCLFEL